MRASTPLEVTFTDRLAMARNAAINGRVFCAMIAATNVAAGQHALAVLAALPVGLAAIVEQLPAEKMRRAGALGAYGAAAAIALASLANLW